MIHRVIQGRKKAEGRRRKGSKRPKDRDQGRENFCARWVGARKRPKPSQTVPGPCLPRDSAFLKASQGVPKRPKASLKRPKASQGVAEGKTRRGGDWKILRAARGYFQAYKRAKALFTEGSLSFEAYPQAYKRTGRHRGGVGAWSVGRPNILREGCKRGVTVSRCHSGEASERRAGRRTRKRKTAYGMYPPFYPLTR
jgi:hypothetical protein